MFPLKDPLRTKPLCIGEDTVYCAEGQTRDTSAGNVVYCLPGTPCYFRVYGLRL